MTHHTEIINHIIEKKGYKSYLEIGTQSGNNFDAIKCEKKTGVDPDPEAKATHHLDSDTFFESTGEKYDLIFIDGLHTAEQVKKDFINAMEHLTDDGVCILHDTNPEKEEWTKVPRVSKQWTGDVYKFICNLGADFVSFPFDYGVTIVKKCDYFICEKEVTWEEFNEDRTAALKITNKEKFDKWI